MYSQVQKCFRFRLVFAWTFMLYTTSTQALSVPQGCAEVAKNVKNWMMDSDVKFDTKFVNNFVDCVRDVYKLQATLEWKTIQKVIPPEIQDLIRAVPKMTKTALPLAGKAGLQFMSAYLLYKTTELYDRAIALEIDQELHRKEFEILRTNTLQPIMGLIDRVDSATLKMILKQSIDNTGLRRVLRVIYKDYKAAESGKIWTVSFGVGSASVCAASLAVGFPVPCIFGVSGVIYSMFGYQSLSNTVQHFRTLIDDVETFRNEMEEYHTLMTLRLIEELNRGFSPTNKLNVV